MKKGEIQLFVFMIIFTRSSENIFNPGRYTDKTCYTQTDKDSMKDEDSLCLNVCPMSLLET